MEIDERLAEIVERLSADLDISRDTLLASRITDLNMDSMDLVTLVFDIEEALDAEIDISELDTTQTVTELLAASLSVQS